MLISRDRWNFFPRRVYGSSVPFCVSELDQKLDAIKEILELNTKSHSLVVDGKTLTLIMAERKRAFSDISHQCATVLCCRMSPLQKAQIVSMAKGERLCISSVPAC